MPNAPNSPFSSQTAHAARAAVDTAAAYGIAADRCDILQNGSTLVLRLTETLVARVVQDSSGPRRGTDWFARENAMAQHLTERRAPVIPLHPGLPPGPHERHGFPLNFWEFVTAIPESAAPEETGRTLYACHAALKSFPQSLPRLAILTECLELLQAPACRNAFPEDTIHLLRTHITAALEVLHTCPHQPLHGDAHPGNALNTTRGLLWTDWEDAFAGPVELDVASAIWNARLLNEDHAAADAIVEAYRRAGGSIDTRALNFSLTARAAVMSAWYPILYPQPGPDRQAKLRHRLEWLRQTPPGAVS